jgi:cytochrome c oxidase subunit 4
MAHETQTDNPYAPLDTGHPTAFTYFKVAMLLVAITAAEVGVFYIEGLGHGIIPILLVLSASKFALVAMFYMHLRFDSRLFTGLFVVGILLAFSVGLALLGLFKFYV